MENKVDITTEITKKSVHVVERIAILRGTTYSEMLDYLLCTSPKLNQFMTLEEINLIQCQPGIETEEEFDLRFRETIKDDVKNIEFSKSEIMILKTAYYFFQMREGESLIEERPHDKGRYKKYKNALDTIDEMLSLSNHLEKENILSKLYQTYELLVISRNDAKKTYLDKMNTELDKLNLTKYAKKSLTDTFQKSL